MKIRHMRLVLPPRLRKTAAFDARTIASAAAEALHNAPLRDAHHRIEIQGSGRPVQGLAWDVGSNLSSLFSRPTKGGS